MAQNLRLQAAVAQLGFASRRAAAEMVKAGKVKVNGKTILQPGYRVNLAGSCARRRSSELEQDTITVDGKSRPVQNKVYLLLNKPKGVVTTLKDKHAGRCVLDLIQDQDARIYPVGRLDKDTTGLLLLTNDGKLAYRLIHPKFGIKKLYRVCVQKSLSRQALKRLQSGIVLEGKKTWPCKIKVVARPKGSTELEIELTEGRKRQIKKMFAAFGHPVLSIERIAFACLRLGALKAGRWRRLKEDEIAQLEKTARARLN
jgi:23S rRNA pseudouridine2605 synthase